MTKTFIVTKVLEGMKKLKKNPCDSILPITPALFSKILLELPSVCSNRYGAFFFKAPYSLAFYAFLRVGEFCLSISRDITSVLLISDFDISRDNTRTLLLYSY